MSSIYAFVHLYLRMICAYSRQEWLLQVATGCRRVSASKLEIFGRDLTVHMVQFGTVGIVVLG